MPLLSTFGAASKAGFGRGGFVSAVGCACAGFGVVMVSGAVVVMLVVFGVVLVVVFCFCAPCNVYGVCTPNTTMVVLVHGTILSCILWTLEGN